MRQRMASYGGDRGVGDSTVYKAASPQLTPGHLEEVENRTVFRMEKPNGNTQK